MSRWVLVDDTDSGIQYSGSWFQDQGSQNGLGNFGPPYQGTLHGINGDGSFSYQFQGTRVLITGSVQFPSAGTTSNPSWVCSVDGTTIPTTTYAISENRLDLCETDTLSDGTHTITVKVTSTDQHTFWFDYVQYFPSANANLDNVALSIDSSDSGINYGTGWTAHAPGQMTQQTGSTLSFSFQGVSLTWIGFYDSSLPTAATTATYSIDGGKPVAFNLNGAAAQSINNVEYNQVFFQTPQLAAGKHTLQVVYQGNAQTAPLTLLILETQGGAGSTGTNGSNGTPTSLGVTKTTTGSLPNSSAPSSSGSSGTSQTSTTSSISSGTSTNLPTTSSDASNSNSSSNTNTPSSNSKSSNHLGAIIGGALGGLALLIAVFLLLFFWRLKRKRSQVRQYVVVDPFQPAPPASTGAGPSSSMGMSTGTGMAQAAVDGRAPVSAPYNNNYNPTNYLNNYASNSRLPAQPGSPTGSSTTNPYSGYVSTSDPSEYAGGGAPTPTSGTLQSQPAPFVSAAAAAAPMAPPLRSKAAEAARNQGRYMVVANDLPTSPAAQDQAQAQAQAVQMSRKVLEAQGPVNRYPATAAIPNIVLSPVAPEDGHGLGGVGDHDAFPRVVRDEDSGLRFHHGSQDGEMVEVLPPTYTPS
ncbi:hypothetical protein CVT26_011907 [Gymnopilus dilepis]|uniref:Uncharacterized protein n=1 Tax=Gymnopilus dilepis TaxID=231916 RepID=A0A409W9C8_9AGAR|nr:hypothetical protein CVT26_011907 [Gymnopilus dilepis]